MDFWTPVVSTVGKVLDKIIPDADKREAAKLELARMAHTGELESLRVQLSAILAEAQSSDPWTSRARPAFLYVVYVLLLSAIPMGVISAVDADIALRIASGAKTWWDAIPADMIALFGVGYLGYTGARTVDKIRQK